MVKIKIIALLAICLMALVFWHPPALALDLFGGSCKGDAAQSSVCQQAKDTQQKCATGKQCNPVTGPNGIISKAANLIAVTAGVVAVIMIIVSGFMFVTAGGVSPGQRSSDPNRIKTARATLTGALVGVVVVALAWTLTRFVTDVIIK